MSTKPPRRVLLIHDATRKLPVSVSRTFFWRHQGELSVCLLLRGFWAKCSKTAEIVPSSTANHTNRAERCTSTPARGPARFSAKEENGARRFGPDFIVLYWIGRKSDPKRRYKKPTPKVATIITVFVLEIPRAANMVD